MCAYSQYYVVIPRKGRLLLGVVRKVETCLCGFLQRTWCLSCWVTLKKVRATPTALLFSPLSSRGALWLLSVSEAWSYQHFQYWCPNRQRSTYLSLQYPAEMDMEITGHMSPYKWPRWSGVLSTSSLLVLLNLALLWVFICSAWSA